MRAHSRYFRDFLAFLVVAGLSLPQVSTIDILAYMEYLHGNGMSPSNITNYVTGIRALHILYGLETHKFRDQRLPLFIKALQINRPLKPTIVLTLDVEFLERIVNISLQLQFPLVFQSLYLFCFSFLRLFNILPHSASAFDNSRHLGRGDVIFGHSKAVIVVKWSKTLQNRCKTATVSIPVLPLSPLCPVNALLAMSNALPASCDSPLFQISKAGVLSPLTGSRARKHLKHNSAVLVLQKPLTFHDFRRAGASWAFQHGVSVQDIQAQGTWSSQCVWRYMHLPFTGSSRVAAAFRAQLSP